VYCTTENRGNSAVGLLAGYAQRTVSLLYCSCTVLQVAGLASLGTTVATSSCTDCKKPYLLGCSPTVSMCQDLAPAAACYLRHESWLYSLPTAWHCTDGIKCMLVQVTVQVILPVVLLIDFLHNITPAAHWHMMLAVARRCTVHKMPHLVYCPPTVSEHIASTIKSQLRTAL
jgi:hypothetical protein